MVEITTIEGLLTFLMNLLAEKFPQSAILKGGMGLRLLDCPRTTNDLDYIFIPYKSKKLIVEPILAVLDDVEGLIYTHSQNSKCLRIKVRYGQIATQIEINAAMECPTVAMTTATLSQKNNQLGRVIQVASYEFSMAHKLAAWNERKLIRDLYDLYFFFAIVKIMPDMDVLASRLNKVGSTTRNKNPKKMTLEQLISKLRSHLESLSSSDLQEIADYLPSNHLPGLELKLRTQLILFCDALENLTESKRSYLDNQL